MFELLLLLTISAVLAISVAVLYGKRISAAHGKYLEAKNAFEDVVISFSRQLQRQIERIDALSSRSDFLGTTLEAQHEQIQALEQDKASTVAPKKIISRVDAVEQKLTEFRSAKANLLEKIAQLESRLVPKDVEAKIESAIPIKREKALAPLTSTELTVLELLSAEGEKTAPQIKEQIGLSREHTARLMKKLYEEGYLERTANTIPFKYRIKEEMQKILKKPAQKR